jgi:hypothetical protein
LDESPGVGGEDLDGDGQQDDPEELADGQEAAAAEQTCNPVERPKGAVDDGQVDDDAGQDCEQVVVGLQRDHRRQRPRAGDEGEGDGHDGAGTGVAVGLEELMAQDHLEAQDEDHHRAAHGERLDVESQDAEEAFPREEEEEHEASGDEGGAEFADAAHLVLQRDQEGDGADDVDHREEGEGHAEEGVRIDPHGVSFRAKVPPADIPAVSGSGSRGSGPRVGGGPGRSVWPQAWAAWGGVGCRCQRLQRRPVRKCRGRAEKPRTSK